MADGEDATAADIEAARREFLGTPPEILDPSIPDLDTSTPDEAEVQAIIDAELNKPPAEGTPAPAPAAPAPVADPYAQWGGEESVRQAMAVQEALRTEQGIRALVANGLTALGYSVEQVRTALDAASATPEPADPFADLDPDEPITIAQARALAEQAAQKAVGAVQAATNPQLEQVQQVVAQQQATAVRAATDAAVVEALGPIPTDPKALDAYRSQVDAVVARGSAYYDPSQWANPDHIKAAVQRAATEINAENEARFQAFLQSKRQTRQGQPPNISGGAGAEGALPEPKSMAEARKQAETAGFFG